MSEETKPTTDVATTETKAVAAPAKRKLPTLTELHHDPELAFKNDEFNMLVNHPPRKEWVKTHPLVKKEVLNEKNQKVKVPLEYISIDTVELLLTRIFQTWSVEVLREGVMFQSVYVTVRLHLIHPVTGEKLFYDGVGAVGVQTDAGKSASDLAAIKQAAIQMALPSAKSYAIKDAAEHIGKLFGKDLNRQFAIDFTMAYAVEPKTPVETLETTHEEIAGDKIPKEIVDKMIAFTTKTEVNVFYKELSQELQDLPEMRDLVKKCHSEIEVKRMKAEQAKQAAEKEGK